MNETYLKHRLLMLSTIAMGAVIVSNNDKMSDIERKLDDKLHREEVAKLKAELSKM